MRHARGRFGSLAGRCRESAFVSGLRALLRGYTAGELRPMAFTIGPGQLMLATLAINLLSLALPLTAMQVYDRILTRGGTDTLNVLTAAVVIAVLAEAGLRAARAWLTGWLGAAQEHALYCAAMQHVLHKDLLGIESHGAGYNAEEMASIGRMREFYSGQALITLVDLPFVAVFLGLIAYLAGTLALVPLALLSFFVFRTWQTSGHLKKALMQREHSDEKRYDFVVEALAGIHTFKALNAEETLLRRYEKFQKRSAEASLSVAIASGEAYNDGILFAQGMGVAVMVCGALMAVGGAVSMGSLVACVLLSGRMMQPVQRALSLWTRFQDLRISREKLDRLFSGARPSVPAQEEAADTRFSPALTLENISFAYRSGEALLQNCSLTVMKHETVAIAGASGSGKSTLLRLMAGLYPPSEGIIRLHGRDLVACDPVLLPGQIGYLATDNVIFGGSVRDNLTGFGAIDQGPALDIARLLGIESEMARLPAGYETLLEDTLADPISPGLKQRIAIARMLARRPRLLLIDNADRALDREGYNQVYRLLSRLRGQVAMVIVSEDRNLHKLADSHYEIDESGMLRPVSSWPAQMQVRGYRELTR